VTSSAPLLSLVMRGGITFLQITSGTNKFISVLNRVSMKHQSLSLSKLASFLRVKTEILERLHVVWVANGSSHSWKDSLENHFGCSSLKVSTKQAALLVTELAAALS